MLSIKSAGIKKNIELFLWLVLAFFAILVLLGMIVSFFNPNIQFFSFVTGFLDFIFSLLSFLNPLTNYLGFTFKPVFGGAPNELTNKNPIIMNTLSNAALTTLFISITAMTIGFIIANFVAVILIIQSANVVIRILKSIFRLYVDIFRSTPLLLQMLIFAYGVPTLLVNYGVYTFIRSFGDHYIIIDGFTLFVLRFAEFKIDELTAAIIALSLNTGAYQTELIRAGILSIPVGQTEASRGLGFSQFQTFRYVILPQALRLIVPPLTNEGINVILNSSLAYVLSVPELTRKAEDLATRWFLTMQLLSTAGIFYFVMTYSLANISKKVEKKLKIPGLGVQHE